MLNCTFYGRWAAWLFLLLGLANAGQAADLAQLSERAIAAKSQFRPITAEHVRQAKSQVLAAKQQLEARRFAAGSPWREQLRWESLESELAKEQPDLGALNAVRAGTLANEPGLEQEEFAQFRERLLDYMNLHRFHANPNTKVQVEQQLDRLAQQLKQYGEKPSTDAALSIGRITGFLESARQADELVSAIREEFWKPNLYVRATERMATSGVAQAISQSQSVNECILGTSVSGRANLFARTSMDFLESPNRAAMAIVLNGTADSSNVGRNSGVTINSTARTNIFVQKQIYFQPTGVYHFAATANASTNSSINSVNARLALVRRIAWRRINQQKATATRIASQRAATRAASQFEARSRPLIAQTQQRYLERFRNPLLRRGAFPRELTTSTTNTHLFVRWLQTSEFDSAAASEPPKPDDGSDLFVRLHESMVGNMSQAAIGGVTLTDETLAKLLEDIGADVPEELKVQQDEDPWSITFAASQPITVRFGDQTVRLAIRGRRFTRGDIKVNDEMDISATYKIETTAGGVKLIRQGDVVAAYVKRGFERAEKITIKTIMRKKFAALFKEELASDGILFPGQSDSKEKLHFEKVKTHGPWLAIGWTLDAPDKTAASADPAAAKVAQAGGGSP